IGHSIVSRSVFVGLRRAVRQMKELLERHGPRETTQ
ncbi:MAG: pyridoxine 5'-phosphate synthase, partial [Planctomycetes bacterium]|nr:pyridoxine 5'-phosphate synthase [Planctomycetota bacterium]